MKRINKLMILLIVSFIVYYIYSKYTEEWIEYYPKTLKLDFNDLPDSVRFYYFKIFTDTTYKNWNWEDTLYCIDKDVNKCNKFVDWNFIVSSWVDKYIFCFNGSKLYMKRDTRNFFCPPYILYKKELYFIQCRTDGNQIIYTKQINKVYFETKKFGKINLSDFFEKTRN